MANDKENQGRAQQLANEMVVLCNAELRAGEHSEDAVVNVLTALQLVVGKTLLVAGVPPATFMELVTKTMMRGGVR